MKKTILTILCIFISFFLFFTIGAGKSYSDLWISRIVAFLSACLYMTSIYIVGAIILKLLRQKENLLFSIVIGTFIFCTLTYIIGTLGGVSQAICLLFILCLHGFGWRCLYPLYKSIHNFLSSLCHKETSIKIILGILLILIVLNLMLLCLPPLDYDVLEYHLGVPAEYLKAGKIFFIENNVYAGFPQSLECIAFFQMRLLGKDLGSFSSQLILWLYGLCTCIAFIKIGMHYNNEKLGFLAALIAYSLPWTAELTRIYYVEIPQMFFLLCCFLFLISKEKHNFLYAGFALGVSAGFKYTALFLGLFAFIPFFLYDKKLIIKNIFFFGCGAFIAYLPWMIRGFYYTHNPIFPLFQTYFSNYWTEWMYARFRQAHIAKSIWWESLGEVFIWGRNVSCLSLCLFIPSLWIAWKKFRSLLISCCIWVMLWIIFTHRIDRFVYPVFIFMCIPMASVVYDIFSQKISYWLYALSCFFMILLIYHSATLTIPNTYDLSLGLCNQDTVQKQYDDLYSIEEFINTKISTPVLFIGEARIYYFDSPVIANTVFNRNLLEELLLKYNDTDVKKILKQQNIFYIYANWNEVARLDITYAFTYQGKQRNGYFSQISLARVKQFLKTQCNIILEEKHNTIYCIK